MWHVVDKVQVISIARDGYVQQTELAEAEAALVVVKRRTAVAYDANRVWHGKVQAATGKALRFASELEAFENEIQINPDGVVDADLLRRPRSD